MGVVELLHADAHGVKAFLAGAVDRKAHAAERKVKELDCPGAHKSGEFGVAASKVGADGTSLAVGHAAQGQVADFAGDDVLDGHAVAARIDGGVGGAHVLVHHHRAKGGHFQPGILGKLAVGDKACGKDHQLGGDFTLVRDHLGDSAVFAFKAQHFFRGEHVNLVGLAVVGGHERKRLGKHAGQNLIHHFHNADFHAPHIGQGHGSLKADEAAAHNDRLAHLALLASCADGSGGFQAGQGKHVFQILAFNGGHARACAGSQHQLVVRQLFFLAGNNVLYEQGFGCPVNGQGARLGAHGDALHIAEKFGVTHGMIRGGAQVVEILYFTGHVVGDAATAVGNEDVFVHKHHFRIGHEALAAASRLGPQGNTTNYQNFFRHIRAP